MNPSTEQMAKRGALLTPKRKSLIRQFKRTFLMAESGTMEWRLRLYEYLRGTDKSIHLSDVKRWVNKYPWISAPLEEGEVRRTEYPLSPSPPSSSQSFHPIPRTPEPALREMAHYQSVVSPILSQVSSAGSSSSLGIGSEAATLPITTPGTSQNLPAMFEKIANMAVGTATASTDASQRQSTSEVASYYYQEEQMKREYYLSAFNAIGILHDICKQMPEVRTCLRPLKEIHRVFVRNHEKFVFPADYSTVRNATLPQVKIDSSLFRRDETPAPEILSIHD